MNKQKILVIILSIVTVVAVCAIIVCSISIFNYAQSINDTQADNSNNIKPTESAAADDVMDNKDEISLLIQQDPVIYTYEDMENDVKAIAEHYSDLVKYNVLTETFDQRNVYDIVVGDEYAENHLLVTGSIHACEYITTKLVMRQLDDFLKDLSTDEIVYNGLTANELLDNCAIHVIPMINPDGVSISQSGLDGLKTEAAKNKIAEIAALDGQQITEDYLTTWKANAEGIDLNRNFDASWEDYAGASHPSSSHYKGASIGCANESRALIELTEKYPFKRTISYHTQGEVIYWYFGQEGEFRTQTEEFAKLISSETGYVLDENYTALDPAGYKDWALDKLNIPSVTIEVGKGVNPVEHSQIDSIWEKNQNVWYAALYNIRQQTL